MKNLWCPSYIDKFDKKSSSTMSISDWNGFELCGKNLPDIALENVLASVPVSDILKLRKVYGML